MIDNENNKILLNDSFFSVNSNSNVTVDLYSEHLKIHNQSNTETWLLSDLAGYYLEESFKANDPSVSFIFNFYPKFKKHKLLRKRLAIELNYSKFTNLKDNLKQLKEWQTILDKQLKQKPFLVFVNPNSGSGKASKLCLNNVLKVWNQANITNNIIVVTG